VRPTATFGKKLEQSYLLSTMLFADLKQGFAAVALERPVTAEEARRVAAEKLAAFDQEQRESRRIVERGNIDARADVERSSQGQRGCHAGQPAQARATSRRVHQSREACFKENSRSSEKMKLRERKPRLTELF
jgi:hypothetical protein